MPRSKNLTAKVGDGRHKRYYRGKYSNKRLLEAIKAKRQKKMEENRNVEELNEASKEIVIACEAAPEGNIEGNVEDESTAIPQPALQSQPGSAGRKSNRQPKQPRSYSPSLLADGQKASKRRKTTPVKRRETERLHDKLPDGSPFCCDLCGSSYVCKPSRKSRSGKVSRHMPYPRFGTDPNTGKSLMMCNACGLAFNRPNKKIRLKASVDQSDKEKYLKVAKEFGDSLAQQLNEPLAERLYCPKFVKKACGCIQTYIVGVNSGNIDSVSQRAQELLEILKAAKELASLKFYDTVTELGVPIPKNKRGTIGLGFGQRRSKLFEAFVLEERKKLKEGQKLHQGFCLCEVACQRLLCYSNNFLHKKLKTVEGVNRVTRTKGKLEMGLLKSIHLLPMEYCCGDKCSRMAISHGKILQRWRSQARVGQADARRVLAEMLTPAGGARPNCYRFIGMVTGCSSSTISRVSEQMRETGGDREPPVHGMKQYWKNKPRKAEEGKKVKPLVDTQLNVPSYSIQDQLLQNQILHHAAITSDGKKVITQRSLLKPMNNQVNVDGLVDVPVTEILSETSVAGSILESFQAIPNQTSLAGQQNQSITIQLAPTYAHTMEHYQVLAQNPNLDSIQFANTSGPLNLSSHTQSEIVAGDGFQNCVLGSGQNVLGVPLGQAITSLVGDAFVTEEVLPRYSDVVSLKKRASEGAKNMSQSNNEREQEGNIIPVSSLGQPIVCSSILPTGGNTVPMTKVLTDAQITGIENDCHTIRNADTDSETILAKVDEKGASSCSVQLNQNVAQTTFKKVISSSGVGKKQPVSLLLSNQVQPVSNQVQPQVLQYQCQQPYSVPYGNSVQYASHQPGSFQLIPAPNGGYQILANTNMCVQPQGQVMQVISPPDGPTVIAGNSKDGIQAGTEKMSNMTSVTPEVKVDYICMKETPINNEQCSYLQENSLTAQSSASNVEYAQLIPSPATGSVQMSTEAAVGVSEDMETGRIQHLSTDQAVACNATSGMGLVDQELGGKGMRESGNRSNSVESPAVIKDISKVNSPVLAVAGLLSKATVSNVGQLAVGKSNNVNFKAGEKGTKERRNDFSNDDSPAMTNISSKVNSSVIHVGQLSRPPVPSSVDVNNSLLGKELVLASLTKKDGASASSPSVMTKKPAGEQERGLKSLAKSSDLKNNVLVVPNPNVVTSPMKPNFVQVSVSPPSGGGVQIHHVMPVPVCSGLMKFVPVRYQYVNSNAGIVSAPPMNLARNIPVIGNSNNLRFVTPDGKIRMFPQRAGTAVAPAPGRVQMTSLGSALPSSYTVQATNSPLISPGNKPIQMVPLGPLRMATGGIQFLNPNFQPIPRSPPPKYRSPLTSSKDALIKKDFKNLVPKPSVASCKGPIILRPMESTVMPEPVGKAVTMVTSASSEKPTTN